MLKIECKGNDAIVTAAGSLKVIAVEMGAALASLYEHLYAENPEAAGSFREIITKMVVDPSSPVWAPEKKRTKFSFVRGAKEISVMDIRAALDAGATVDMIKVLLED